MNGNRRIGRARFTLGVAAVTVAVALCVIVGSGRDSPAPENAQFDAASSSGWLTTAQHAVQSRVVDASDSRSSLPALLVDDLTNAQENPVADERELMIARLLVHLVEIDSQAAAQFAEHVTDASLREVSLRVVAQSWAHVDVAAATQWAASLGDVKERDQAILNVSLELVQSDPLQAVQLLQDQLTAQIPAGVLEGVVQQWAEQSYDDALAWSETLPPGARRELVLQRLVFVRASQNPMDAARLAEAALVDRDRQSDALASVASSWGSRDMTSAREWALTLDGAARSRVDAELALLGDGIQ